MNQIDPEIFLHKLARNRTTNMERQQFSAWVNSLDEQEYRRVLDQYHQILLQYPETGKPFPALERKIEERLDHLPKSTKTIPLKKWWDAAMVASVLLLVAAGTWYALGIIGGSATYTSATEQITSRYGDDVRPGSEKATLTLSDGQTFVLDEIPEGQLNLKNGVQVTKTGDGAIAYEFTSDKFAPHKNPTYHTITTPVGGEYQVILPDGSRVWLNSMSSITSPDFFDKNQRIVKVTGEVFFEIAEKRNKEGLKIPFLVRTANQTVEVLGTRFNIKSYPDLDAVETTLVEGKVGVSTADRKTTLNPGEQSQVKPDGQIALRTNVNISKIIDWKNGYFHFSDDSIEDIMKELSRWYGIQPEYAGELPDTGFGGQISRQKNISEVLRILELTDEVNFQIIGRKVKVKANLSAQ